MPLLWTSTEAYVVMFMFLCRYVAGVNPHWGIYRYVYILMSLRR